MSIKLSLDIEQSDTKKQPHQDDSQAQLGQSINYKQAYSVLLRAYKRSQSHSTEEEESNA